MTNILHNFRMLSSF